MTRPSRSSNGLKWAVAIVSGLALAVVLVVGMNMSATTYTVNDEGDVLADGETIVQGEAPAASGASTGSGDPAFDYAIKKLASMRQESADELRDAGMTIDLPEVASDDNTSEELLGKYQSDLHSVLKIGQTDPAEARRLLVGIVSPDDTDDFNGISKDLIGKYGPEFVPQYGFGGIPDWSDNFYTPMIQGVEANGSAMRYIDASTIANPDIWHQMTFRRDNGEWIVHKIVTVDDPSFISDTFEFNKSIPPR